MKFLPVKQFFKQVCHFFKLNFYKFEYILMNNLKTNISTFLWKNNVLYCYICDCYALKFILMEITTNN